MIITTLDELKLLGHTLRTQGKTVVWTNGCFDLMHPGHLKTFHEAKKLADILIVWLNWDHSPYRTTKPGRPINDVHFRSQMVAALQEVDHVYIYEEETPLLPISTLLPDILLKGGDYEVEKIVGYEVVTKNGGQVVTIPVEAGYSTTGIIDKILATYSPDEQ